MGDIVLAHLVDLLDGLDGIFAGEFLLLHHAGDAALHGGLDEDAEVVGVIPEHIEAGTAGDDAGLIFRYTLDDLALGLEDIVRFEEVGLVAFHWHVILYGIGQIHVGNPGTLELCPPVVLEALEALDFFRGEVILL